MLGTHLWRLISERTTWLVVVPVVRARYSTNRVEAPHTVPPRDVTRVITDTPGNNGSGGQVSSSAVLKDAIVRRRRCVWLVVSGRVVVGDVEV